MQPSQYLPSTACFYWQRSIFCQGVKKFFFHFLRYRGATQHPAHSLLRFHDETLPLLVNKTAWRRIFCVKHVLPTSRAFIKIRCNVLRHLFNKAVHILVTLHTTPLALLFLVRWRMLPSAGSQRAPASLSHVKTVHWP